MIQNKGKRLWLLVAAVGIGLSLLVSGCGDSKQKASEAEKPKESIFLSVDLAEEELRGNVKRVKIAEESSAGKKEIKEVFFTSSGRLEKEARIGPDGTVILRTYDEKGRMATMGLPDTLGIRSDFDEEKNTYIRKLGDEVLEEGELDPKSKRISRSHMKESGTMTEITRNADGLILSQKRFHSGKAYDLVENEYNEWGQKIFTRKVIFDFPDSSDKVMEKMELTYTYEKGVLIGGAVKMFEGEEVVIDFNEPYKNEDIDEQGNWRKRKMELITVIREIEYY
jgi:hypothetical protein